MQSLLPAPPQISYADLSQIVLGAAGVAVALLAIVIAVTGALLGFFGYQSIKTSAIEAAEKAAKARLEEYFAAADLPKKIDDEIKRNVSDKVQELVTALMPFVSWGTVSSAPSDTGTEKVGNDYPDK